MPTARRLKERNENIAADVNTLGFAGAKMIRRILGLAHVEDLESIEDTDIRAACETRALNLAGGSGGPRAIQQPSMSDAAPRFQETDMKIDGKPYRTIWLGAEAHRRRSSTRPGCRTASSSATSGRWRTPRRRSAP